MANTVSGILLTGDHASRPSSGLTYGTIYACSTHYAIEQTTDSGSTWVTWPGLGTTAPNPTTIELGHASDTTLARASAGNITVEGNAIYRAGGTDVPVADGGTGSSTAAGAATNLGLGTGDSPQFTAVNVGHASDTTLARASAGQVTVEGATVLLGSIATTKGDILAATGSGAITRLGVGSNTHVLTADSGEATGIKWAAAAGGTPSFSGAAVYKAAAQTVTAATEYSCVFDTEDFDVGGYHDNVTNNTRLTVPTTGKYFVTANIYHPTTPGSCYANIRINGTTSVNGSEDDNASNTSHSLHPSCIVSLTAGDYIEVRGYRTTGTSSGAGTGPAANACMITFLGS
jgi:hypothetical protein